VDLCKDGLEAFICFEKQQHHICILDVMMPKIDGFELAKKIRAKDSGIPILFLTARTMEGRPSARVFWLAATITSQSLLASRN
jgi:DNA-binding response OmpR family regulator